MGIFNVELEIGDPEGRNYRVVEAMADSGATYTTLPESLLRGLGVESRSNRTFILADGSRIRRGFGQTWIRLEGEENISPVIFWDDEALPLLGAVTLEIFSLGIDPVNGRLIPLDSFLLAASHTEELMH
jgi:predicted aspartyl protease